MHIKDKVILTDIDGVMLDWEYAFHQWMTRHGFEHIPDTNHEYNLTKRYKTTLIAQLVRMFNESAWIRKLPPLRDAMYYVRKLHVEHGYVFHAITSLSNDAYSQHLRTKNLRELFGDTVFEKYTYLDTGARKDEVLAQFAGTGAYWIEDKTENADVGVEIGLRSLLMNHEYNQDYTGAARRVQNWEDIYTLITDDHQGLR